MFKWFSTTILCWTLNTSHVNYPALCAGYTLIAPKRRLLIKSFSCPFLPCKIWYLTFAINCIFPSSSSLSYRLQTVSLSLHFSLTLTDYKPIKPTWKKTQNYIEIDEKKLHNCDDNGNKQIWRNPESHGDGWDKRKERGWITLPTI